MKIAIDELRIDGGTQARAQLNQSAVDDYAEAYASQVAMPPVIVYFDGSEYWLADGFHRYHGARSARLSQIDADIRPGTVRDAVLFSLSANSTHGLRRSNEDKRKAVQTLLGDAEWRQWSDRKIAEACGVGHPFVAALRNPEIATKQAANRAASAERKSLRVESDSTPEVLESVRHGEIGLPKAEAIARMPAEEQAQAIHEPVKKVERHDDALAAARAMIADLTERLDDLQAVAKDLEAQIDGEADKRLDEMRAELKSVAATRDRAMKENAALKREVKMLRRKLGVAA